MAVERRFELVVGGERVTGLVWVPERARGPLPTVLLGHGRGDDKNAFGLEQPGRRFADGHGWAAVAIDAAGHGERRDADADARPPIPDPVQARREWQATIERLIGEGVIDPRAIAYWGFSMGAALGISLIAHEPRIKCAVIGLMRSGYYPHMAQDAARVSCPVRFSLHDDDRLMPRAQCIELFELLGSQEKQLGEYGGRHNQFSAAEIDAGEAFLRACLGVL